MIIKKFEQKKFVRLTYKPSFADNKRYFHFYKGELNKTITDFKEFPSFINPVSPDVLHDFSIDQLQGLINFLNEGLEEMKTELLEWGREREQLIKKLQEETKK